jgi:glycerol-3-phosphate dehydrogenase
VNQADFSAATRSSNWEQLGSEPFDLLVIGAGITGAGVARDAALRGLQVALVDAGDIGGGTSSRSSRLVHGGLRYLETFDFALVFEALIERRRLLKLAPHLVHPLPFLFPVFRGDPTGVLKLGAGMWLYETLSLFRSPRRHRLMSRRRVREQEPGLRTEGLKGGALYFDAQVDDARLTLAVARGAHEAGATVVPYAKVTEIEARIGAMSSAAAEDRLSGRATRISARLIINAGGPWSDRIRCLADPSSRPRLRTTKGVHILVDRDRVGHRNAIIFRSAVDGRVMFVLPWGRYTYVGTTDTESPSEPGEARADSADVEYLLRSVNSIFPGARLGPADVLSTWTGLRPLLAPERGGPRSESATSREHAIWRDGGGMLNVAGGKLTTYRSMAAETADRAARILEAEFGVASGRCYTEFLPLPGAPEQEWSRFTEEFGMRAAKLGLEAAEADHLAQRHGGDADRILSLLEAHPELAEPVAEGHPYLRAEVVHAVRCEMATSLEDVLRRRTQIFYEAGDGGVEVARMVAETMAAEAGLGWSASEVDEQLRRYEAAVNETRPPLPS